MSALRVEEDGPVRVLTLDRPDALNAIDHELHEALADVWPRLDADREARAVVLTGSGRAFCAGGDLDWIRDAGGSDEGAASMMKTATRIITGMLGTRLPVVAAVNGPAIGLGCTLTVLSDLVLASPDAWFSDPHVGVGLAAGDGGILWSSLTGMHVAKEFLFLGGRLPADDAVRAGLANRVVPAESLREESLILAHRLAELPAPALQGTKRAMNSMLMAAWPSLENGIAAEERSMRSVEHHARLAEVRPPTR
ncbi:enoyl-CoA hydratase/isomerase family protein [Microbacterium immunditiarum]|uniref:Enoyl-CoA hydratase n=1 Tax=Microbacterium immunditiarum TaxID=337480 RepID=A0A7Y9GLN6_9MICO|nr:enoyl-CoA hydratase/isomerase family protein [Microbacterium immunditiarum]NYE18798.1 enoyl-CoA hydratase [Microbacterium immunditiarum]